MIRWGVKCATKKDYSIDDSHGIWDELWERVPAILRTLSTPPLTIIDNIWLSAEPRLGTLKQAFYLLNQELILPMSVEPEEPAQFLETRFSGPGGGRPQERPKTALPPNMVIQPKVICTNTAQTDLYMKENARLERIRHGNGWAVKGCFRKQGGTPPRRKNPA
jgi:hypothetical protein